MCLWELVGDGTLEQALCGGGDLASAYLDEGYAWVDRVLGTQSHHATVIGALALESSTCCTQRDATPWAAITAMTNAGPGDSLASAVEKALALAGAPDVQRWYVSHTERYTAEQENLERLAGLRGIEQVPIRRRIGDSAGAGAASIAVAASAIAMGECSHALLTTATRHGTTYVTVLSEPGRSAS